LEKSLIFLILLKYEKNISPKKNDKEIAIEKNKLKLNRKSKKNDTKKEDEVPDQVFLGLIDGIIKGPLKILPIKKAIVSLIKDITIIRKKRFLFSSIR